MYTNYISPVTAAILDNQIFVALTKALAAAGDTSFFQDSRWYLQRDESAYYEGINLTTKCTAGRAMVGLADYDVFSDAAGVFSSTFGAIRRTPTLQVSTVPTFGMGDSQNYITARGTTFTQDESSLSGLVLPLPPTYLATAEWDIRPSAFDVPTPVFGGFSGVTGSWETSVEGSRWGLHGYTPLEAQAWSLFTDMFSPSASSQSIASFVLQLVDVWVLLVLRALDALNDAGLGDPFSFLRPQVLGSAPLDTIVCHAEALTGSWAPAAPLAANAPVGPVLAGVSLHTMRGMLKQYYHLLGNLDYLNDWRELKFEREI